MAHWLSPKSSFMTQQGTLKMQDMKLRDMKMRHHVAGVENARHENAAPDCRGGKCETWKCEKRDSMEHRVLHMSVHCQAGMHESTRKRKLCCQLCCQLCCTDYILIIRFYSSYICHLKYLKTTTGRTLRLHLNRFRHWLSVKHNTAFLYNIGRAGRK